MQINVQEQIKFLTYIFISGMLCGVIYDIIRARRKLFDLGNICVNIEDVIFCILTGVVFLTVTFYLNSGIIRISGFFGIIFGEFIYFILMRNHMRNFFIKIAKSFKKILNIFLNIIFLPIKIIKRLIKRPIYIAVWYVGGRLRRLKTKLYICKNLAENRLRIVKIFIRKRSKKH